MDERLRRIVQLNPNYFAFISGVAISASVNLLTGLVSENPSSKPCWVVPASAALFFFSSVAFIILSWQLEDPFNKWKRIRERSDLGWDDPEKLEVAAGDGISRLWILLILGTVLLVCGSVVLLF